MVHQAWALCSGIWDSHLQVSSSIFTKVSLLLGNLVGQEEILPPSGHFPVLQRANQDLRALQMQTASPPGNDELRDVTHTKSNIL